MQQPVSRRDVYGPGMSAVVNGRVLDVSQVQVDRSLPDPLAGGSLTAASASFTAVEGDDVTRTVATPWDPSSVWPPAPESPVSVSMDTGAGPVSLLAGGRVVSASGGTSGREVEVEAADRYQSLDRTISWDALADAMPSESDGAYPRYVGLQSVAITDRMLRHCGWFATPPVLGYSTVSVPAVGTMWPERGAVESCIAPVGGAYPSWANTSWGVGVSDVSALYRPQTAYTLTQRPRVELAAMAGPANGGGMRLDLTDGTDVFVRLSWTDAWAYVWLRDSGGGLAVAAQIPRTVGLVYATVNRLSSTSVQVVLRHGGGSVSQVVTVPSSVTSAPFSRVWIVGDGIGSGFQVAYPSTAGTLEGWVPSAVIYPRPSNRNSLHVLKSVEGENCADLLAGQCEAECATYWIDETGVLRWWDLARLEARSSVAVLTSDDDIGDAGFSWSHDLSQVKSRVAVQWSEPLRERSWMEAIDLWQGSGKTLQPGEATAADPAQEWINTPDDEVWIMPDLTPTLLGPNDLTEFNYGRGTHYGAVTRTAEGLDRWAHLSGTFSASIERVTGRSFKMSTFWTGTTQAVMRSPDEDSISNVWGVRRGMDLPILRGRAKFTLTDRTTYSSQSGPGSAPEHAIDAGWWIQRAEQAQITADYAAARLTVPQPVLSSVDLVPLPGLQLGDMVTVQDTSVTRLTIKGIVTDDSRDIDAAMGMSHAVTIRPTAVTRNGVTWQEWALYTKPKTWTQWSNAEGGTWQQWGSNPLNE